ncbi:MAG: ribosome maturation factor RimM [Alphaproteobacteria bacterium]|jgi:16S rRNA processing protein RimM|nr:ribosome maturation factor RimM [Alphaproteobacteria bacterium]MDP6270363.1 ribosome maturation factor RimM [Alphaproteobacteria bacterium]MDP7164802.1 ribosome maturation factor RimM [Alphaproteobacteria bacterium]MDP7429299.1 ribosome maturation factor RimM [Alphaproteobacteria bacterium]
MPERVCLGAISGARGLRGEVKVKTFTARPADVAAYGPLTDEVGERSFTLTVTRTIKGGVAATIAGIADRQAALALKGTRLYVSRQALPKPEGDEFYYADLIGLAVELEDGGAFGTVKSLENHGAGELLVVDREGVTEFLPFTAEVVPSVDLEAGRLVVRPPAEMPD